MTDSEWVQHAASRGEVLVHHENRLPVRATLIAWRPHRPNGGRRNIARVQFVSGAQATVKLAEVTLVETSHVS